MPAGADEHDLPDLDAGTDADGNPITATHPLRYRPAHYVPFKVPLYDEQYTQVQQDLYDQAQQDNPDTNIKEPEPLYRWYYRPELQFSQYDFDAKSLIVKQTDENDNETTSSIDISEDGADFGPLFDEYTDSVELLFDLLGPELERLPPLETEREFVLSLGGEEVLATIGQDGKVVFENPEHLNRLSEEDLLSLRLYLNGDSANVLWEYHLLGVSPFWSIYPNQLPQKIRKLDQQVEEGVAQLINLQPNWFIPNAYADPFNDERNVEHGESYLALGGMRIKLLFNGEDDSERKALYYRWSIVSDNANSKFYDSEKPEYNTVGELVGGASQLTRIWGAPEVWLEAGEWITNRETKIKLDVIYSISEIEEIEFTVSSRGLKPTSPEPMQGADVAMLESLLWQLGISPQFGYPGEDGARINSHRGYGKNNVDLGNTKICGTSNDANDRSKYYTGWKGSCLNSQVSLEGMVRRFQGRTFEPSNLAGHNTSGNVDGIVGNGTLDALKKVYDHYRQAVYEFADQPRYIADNIPDAWWTSLALLMESGGSIPYDNAAKNHTLEPTYTEAIHAGIKKEFPDNAQGLSREGILRAWNFQENAGEFWGTGSVQRTPFRIYEGSGDEEGSFGFNHIVWKRMYGASPDCDSLRGYLEGAHNINLFNPKNSLFAFLAATADDCGSSRGLYWSYVKPDDETNGYAADIPESERPKAYCYLDKDDASRCELNEANKDNWIEYKATKVAGQELLGKAIIAYNRGANKFGDRHYFSTTQMLKSDPNKKQPNRTFDYWMKIKEKTQTIDGINGYVPYVTYLWQGGLGFDANGSGGALENIPDDPLTPDVDESYDETSIPWCFMYGERDWISPGFKIVSPDDPTKRILAGFNNYLERADINDEYKYECI